MPSLVTRGAGSIKGFGFAGAGVPGAPTGLSAIAGNTQATISFTAPSSDGGIAITGYTVTSSGGQTATGTSSPIIVTGLTNGTAYTFTVKATNAAGTGPNSTNSSSVTPATVPGAPTGVSAIAGIQQATISFTAPTNNGGSAITGYTVTSSGGQTATGTSSPIIVTGLTGGTAYTFTVKATNAAGTGPNSTNSSSVTPTGVPSSPTNMSVATGDAQVIVSFTAPTNNGGSAITGYTVTSSGGQTITGSSSPITLTGLTNGTSYTIGLTATNSIGSSTAVYQYDVVPNPIRSLWVWGDNGNGALGLGNNTNYSSPKQVGSSTNWSSTAGKSSSRFVVNASGTLFAAGVNDFGQLGIGTTTNVNVFTNPFISNVSKVSAAQGVTAAIKSDGTLWTWGVNDTGQLGLGNMTNYSEPKQVGAVTTWSDVSIERQHCLALKQDGTLWAWGSGSVGRLGLGNQMNYSSPKQVGSLTTWSNISAAHAGFSHAIRTNGTLWAWGQNYYGSLGVGVYTNLLSPTQVGSLTNWTDVKTASTFALGLTSDGKLWAWGDDVGTGAMGLNNAGRMLSPTRVGVASDWAKIYAGAYKSFAIKTTGTAWAWGQNYQGELGVGDNATHNAPYQIGTATNWVSISNGMGIRS